MFRCLAEGITISFLYLLLLVPGEDGDSVVEKMLCELAESLADETE